MGKKLVIFSLVSALFHNKKDWKKIEFQLSLDTMSRITYISMSAIFSSTSCFVLRKVSKMTCFFSLPIFKYNSAHSRTRIFTFFYFISLHSRQLPTPTPSFLASWESSLLTRCCCCPWHFTLYFIYSFRSRCFILSHFSAIYKKKAAIFTRRRCPHLSSFFPLTLFFISFMLRTCDLWTWRGV